MCTSATHLLFFLILIIITLRIRDLQPQAQASSALMDGGYGYVKKNSLAQSSQRR
jgi:hypothetical protein